MHSALRGQQLMAPCATCWIRRFILYHGKRHPRDLGGPEVAAFLSYLANERDVAALTQNDLLAPLVRPAG